MRKPKPPHCFLSIFFTLVLTGISYGAEKYSNSKVTIHADSINYSATKEVVIATGNVVVKRDQTRLQCDYAKLDNSTEIAVLEGNVIVEDPETRLESRRAVINLKNNM
ncbi:MAG: LptA/OstA family protein, partial [Nitrospinota bacterium]